jgi:membrane-associated phospholipid phosphatase
MTMSPFNPWQRLESFIYFLQRWLQRNWQPLLFLFGIYVPLAVFAILAMQIWQLEGGLWWDVAIMQAIHAAAQPQLDVFVSLWTNLGTRWGVIPISVGIGIGLLYARRWRFLTYWLITLVGCGLINHFAKLWLHRVRPSLWEYPPVSEFSFPSGHAMTSMGFVTALVVLTWNANWRIWVWLLGGLFAVSIGWTRLYLGVHYPSDILAGWMMAVAWAIGVNLVVKPLSSTLISTQSSTSSLTHSAQPPTQTPPHSSDLVEP